MILHAVVDSVQVRACVRTPGADLHRNSGTPSAVTPSQVDLRDVGSTDGLPAMDSVAITAVGADSVQVDLHRNSYTILHGVII